MVVSENGGFSPQIIHFDRDFHYKSSILGYPYFWKHPYTWGNHGKWSNSTGAWGAEAKVWQEWTPGFQQRNLLCFAWSTLFIFMFILCWFFQGCKIEKRCLLLIIYLLQPELGAKNLGASIPIIFWFPVRRWTWFEAGDCQPVSIWFNKSEQLPSLELFEHSWTIFKQKFQTNPSDHIIRSRNRILHDWNFRTSFAWLITGICKWLVAVADVFINISYIVFVYICNYVYLYLRISAVNVGFNRSTPCEIFVLKQWQPLSFFLYSSMF